MKEKMWKYFTANSTRVYIDVLDKLVQQYSSAKHASIKMTPVEASKKKNENSVWTNLGLYGSTIQTRTQPKMSVGDQIRITKKKKTFEKGYTSRWMKMYLQFRKLNTRLQLPIR